MLPEQTSRVCLIRSRSYRKREPRFAVSGFTLSVCLYLGIKIRRWWLAAAVFVFIHSFTSILPEKSSLQSYVSMKNNSIIT